MTGVSPGDPLPPDAQLTAIATVPVSSPDCSAKTYIVAHAGSGFMVTTMSDAPTTTICGVYNRDPSFETPDGVSVGVHRSALRRFGPPVRRPKPRLFPEGPVHDEVYSLPSGWLAVFEETGSVRGDTLTLLALEPASDPH